MARQQKPRPLDATAQLKLYVPEALRREVEREAKAAGTTMNGVITRRLAQSYADRGKVGVKIESALYRMLLLSAGSDDEFEGEIVKRLRQSFDNKRLSYRPSARIRDELRTASEYNRRSLDAEVEARIEQSFTVELEAYGHPVPARMKAAINGILDLLTSLELFSGRRFGEDPWLYEQARVAVDTWFQLHRPPGEVKPPEEIRTGDMRHPAGEAKPLPDEVVAAFGAWLAVKEAVEPQWYPMVEWLMTLRRFTPIPADPTYPMPPGSGSAVRRKAAELRWQLQQQHRAEESEEAAGAASKLSEPMPSGSLAIAAEVGETAPPSPIATLLLEARRRVVEKLTGLVPEWRFVRRGASIQTGSWYFRDGERWIEDYGGALIFEKVKTMCCTVSNTILEEGGSDALAREICSYDTTVSVERMMRRSLAGDIVTTPANESELDAPESELPPRAKRRRPRDPSR